MGTLVIRTCHYYVAILYSYIDIGIDFLRQFPFGTLDCHYIAIYLDCYAGRYLNRGFTYS